MHFELRRSGLPRRSATEAAAMAAFTIVWAGLLGAAHAADIKDVACRTTAECLAEAARVRGEVSKNDTSRTAELQDVFYWTNRVNMASTVMLQERGLLDKATAARIAEGIQHAVAQASKPGGKRPTDYLQIENIIAEKAGPEATFIHAGRSRQDILATVRVSRLRTAVMDVADRLLVLRKTLLDIAEQHKDTLVPAYTNGVQAQPITYGHYLLAFADSFARDSARIRDLYGRLNLSPMGTAVLANSAWPLDRVRLAELLGFDGLVVNSLDA
ncbi:MAG: lyase family protein, partial [Betaproteobacteria bacterium]